MEDTLRVLFVIIHVTVMTSLNPYYNGRYSPSTRIIDDIDEAIKVLILIIMEDTLRDIIYSGYDCTNLS